MSPPSTGIPPNAPHPLLSTIHPPNFTALNTRITHGGRILRFEGGLCRFGIEQEYTLFKDGTPMGWCVPTPNTHSLNFPRKRPFGQLGSVNFPRTTQAVKFPHIVRFFLCSDCTPLSFATTSPPSYTTLSLSLPIHIQSTFHDSFESHVL